MKEANCDVQFLQEVDKSSKRSYFVDQTASLSNLIGGTSAFAVNYSCPYVPFPLPTIGKVQSGLLTLNSFGAENAQRIALTGTYTWPVRVAQLKRCLLVERVPLKGSDKELVLVNLHLEAYDDGDAKQVQTEELLKLLTEEYEKGNYCIAGGDFNQTFSEIDHVGSTSSLTALFLGGLRGFDNQKSQFMDWNAVDYCFLYTTNWLWNGILACMVAALCKRKG